MRRHMVGNFILPSHHRALFLRRDSPVPSWGPIQQAQEWGWLVMVFKGLEKLQLFSSSALKQAKGNRLCQDKTDTEHSTSSSDNRLEHGTAELGQGWQQGRDCAEGKSGESAEPGKPSLP